MKYIFDFFSRLANMHIVHMCTCVCVCGCVCLCVREREKKRQREKEREKAHTCNVRDAIRWVGGGGVCSRVRGRGGVCVCISII